LSYYGRFGGYEYLGAAQTLGFWVLANVRESRAGLVGYTGGFDGWEPTPLKRLYKSTEHNLDLMAAFRRLYQFTGDPAWASASDFAKQFVQLMWDDSGGKFWTGTLEDGQTIFTDVIPTDVQAWAVQAFGPTAGPYVRALDWAEANNKVESGYGFKQTGNNRRGDKIWYEGTAQMALSWLLAGNRAKYSEVLAALRSAQHQSGGMYAASADYLDTGFHLNDGQPWYYFRRLHCGATAWLALAERGVNPFWF
jgi:hypothetical protein